MFSVVRKIYAGIIVDRVHKGIEGLNDEEQGSFRVGKDCVNQVFTLNQIGEKTQENLF